VLALTPTIQRAIEISPWSEGETANLVVGREFSINVQERLELTNITLIMEEEYGSTLLTTSQTEAKIVLKVRQS
jgi:Flp pilus assembly secretin CpaC